MNNNTKKMQKKLFSEKFDEFFKNNFSYAVSNFERERLKSIKQSKIIKIILSILFSIGLIYYFVFSQKVINDIEVNIAIVIFPIAFVLFVSEIPEYIYKDKVKKNMYPKLLSFLGDFKFVAPNDYDKKDEIEKYVETLDLFGFYNQFICDDIIIGKYKDIEVQIAEIKLSKKRRKSSITVFDGILLTFNPLRSFSSKTVIKRDSFFKVQNMEKVNLEDPEFEQIYDVYSNDQIEARCLITPAFMERMINCNGEGQLTTVSFENNKVNIAIHNINKNWFEVSIDKPATDIANYRKILLEIYEALSFIEVLKFDENIGM